MKAMSEAVCVLGMHRSGTSMITRALNYVGVDLGKESNLNTMGKMFNPEGYWEHKGIMLRQQQILKTFSRSWDTRLPLPDNWWKYRAIVPYKNRLKEIVINEFSDKRLWGWKDPRTSLLLPMWQGILQELNINLSYVIVVRNPLDVAASLCHRNGFSKKKSFSIWCLYTLLSLIGTEQSNRVIIHYDQFLNSWESKIKEIISILGCTIPDLEDVRKSLDLFIDPALRHSQSSLDDLIKEEDASKMIVSLYKLMLKTEEFPDQLNCNYFKNQIHEMYKELYG